MVPHVLINHSLVKATVHGAAVVLHHVLHHLEQCTQLQPQPVVLIAITVKDKVVKAMVHGLDHIHFHHRLVLLHEQVKPHQL